MPIRNLIYLSNSFKIGLACQFPISQGASLLEKVLHQKMLRIVPRTQVMRQPIISGILT